MEEEQVKNIADCIEAWCVNDDATEMEFEVMARIIVKAAVKAGLPSDELVKAAAKLYGA